MPPDSSHFHPLEIQLNGHEEYLFFSKNSIELGTNLTITFLLKHRKISLHHVASPPFFPLSDKLMFSVLWGFNSLCLQLEHSLNYINHIFPSEEIFESL